ncbi:4-hydroxybenzoate polyprenyltransferase [Photobacterium iliopiscarium]|jgi:4-hydroxybenzoate polyprenyltransferase|uniref:4-hydroxybenzoate octaprenyltransferase n=1 Tax=Photobacterium iliopiscarium TaxID=56192 RepID=A0ABX5GU54_9GAMM|nr:4-hydroxybenzoate octaprenyltransferase [Photobacterium iliopiscarium]KJG14006.1 4-hydroxybenzoate polyprenyltransferase [Photobacterium iliopiscarium]KJG25468.1 4-hydroxybenzoate polyprenyltransferase [Photobacterium iliopiscarium]MCD9466116.1 4-hydroxybenzoate octaprenyltransferase [Photobacterium iliopiscarium]MCD9485710.1 4-hydroxybenzoate octaprenyltransferase [Photobacterium iliopiscarium]MCF2242407.1 4-hydroxybenzoate octaprenyltransferase [Photobacterium iliopiscarium]
MLEITKARAFWQLARFDRPIGSLLLLWPTLWALFLAGDGFPKVDVLVVFVLGVVFMRAAGCVINDFADRNVDGHVKRTANRPMPSGKVSEREALGLFILLVLVSFLLVLTMNNLTIMLSVVAVMLAAAYPFMKRYTHLPQLVLGAAFGWSIPMAYAAQSGTLPTVAWLLFVANILWTVAYDTLYAMVDRDDDIKVGIKSTAILFGRFDKLIIGILQLVTIMLLIAIGGLLHLNQGYYWALLVASALFVYQQMLIQGRQREQCFKAFLNNNYVGMVIFIGISLSVLWQ